MNEEEKIRIELASLKELNSSLERYASQKTNETFDTKEISDIIAQLYKRTRQIVFFEDFTSLLKEQVTPKSEETLAGEEFCDNLKLHITQLYERAHRLDLFSDDFNLSNFISRNVEFPLERLKEQIEKTWLKDKLTIGFMGHFSAGKTTALNLLFDEKFQVNGHENTALATYLTYGSKKDIVTIVDKAGLSQELTLEQCSILDYSNGVEGFPFARIYNYMVKENDANILKDLTIIDTPGLFSTSTGHSAPTMNVVSSCDAVFWFINITLSLTDEDVEFLTMFLQGKPIYVIFSYIDARGTTPSKVDSSIKDIKAKLEKEKINVKGYLTLGKKEGARSKFKNDAIELLKNLSEEYDVYSPGEHISKAVNILEGFLVECRSNYTEQIAKLDKETDNLFDAYSASSRTFVTECNNSTNRFNNMVDTFNNRCSGSLFCGGASDALCNNINSITSSLRSMVKAYNNMDVQKLIDYGNGVARMQLYQYKLDEISKILSDVKNLKESLDI